MNDIIAYLEGVVTPDTLECLFRLEKVFTSVNYTDHQAQLINAFANDDLNPFDKGAEMVGVYETQADYLLLLMGVFVLDEPEYMNFHIKARLLESLFASESIDNLDVLTEVTQDHAEAEPLDYLCALLAAMTDKSDGFYQDRIAAVDLTLVTKLKKLASVPEAHEHLLETQKGIKKEFMSFLDAHQGQGLVYHLVKDKGTIPIDYVEVVAALQANFTGLGDRRLVQELYAGLIVAGVAKDKRYLVGNTAISDLSVGTSRELTLPNAYEELFRELTNE